MAKHTLARLGLVLTLLAMALFGLKASTAPVRGAQDAAKLRTNRASPTTRVEPLASPSLDFSGQVVTQTLTLRAGWNAITLEVEPINPSPLVDPDGSGPRPPAPEKSTLEAVFAGLTCGACLESVWTWNVPVSKVDYIVDPAEGLWDEPGWKRYFPETSLGPDGASRAFLTDLVSLHANTGYLVKLSDSLTVSPTLTVVGRPGMRHNRWVKGSYGLAGFPFDPDANPPVTVALLKNASPITDILELTPEGRWRRLEGHALLQRDQAYLVYYDDQDPNTPDDFTAPLDLLSVPGDGLQFSRGTGNSSRSVTVKNLSSVDASVVLALPAGAQSGVALYYVDSSTTPATLVDLRQNTAQIGLLAGAAKQLDLQVVAAEQSGDGETLLEVSSPDLGTRWRVPVTAKSGSLEGLWVGDATVDDVSEGRLGATNVQSGSLTIAMRPLSGSGIRGASELREEVQGNTASVALTVTLALPTPTTTATQIPLTGTTPYVRGYVFEDTNQNGQRDATERGFAGITVTLTVSGTETSLYTRTAADGSYLLAGLLPGETYNFTLDPWIPAGTTPAFEATLPLTRTDILTPTVVPNALPQQLGLDDQGVSQLVTRDYTGVWHTLNDFPRYDAEDNRVEPFVSFGYVSAYDASLWTGTCANRIEDRGGLGQVVNGVLQMTRPNTSLNPQLGQGNEQLLGAGPTYVIYIAQVDAPGVTPGGVACGELSVATPTRFANGGGSVFKMRLLLRVTPVAGANPPEYKAELLPYYVHKDTAGNEVGRVTAPDFSIQAPLDAIGGPFGNTGQALEFWITIGANDPLNPFKHRYHPDHDNLDAQFNPIDLDAVDPYLSESYEVRRRISLELTELPPYEGADEALAAELNWGGETWGGLYKEVISGIHKNDITVKGTFVLEQVLTSDALQSQSYDP